MQRAIRRVLGLVLLATAAVSAPAADATRAPERAEGTYDARIVAEGAATFDFVLTVAREGTALKPRVQNGGEIDITAIAVDGEKVTLTATYQGDPFTLPGTFTETGMGGKWEAGGYHGTWSAKRRAQQ